MTSQVEQSEAGSAIAQGDCDDHDGVSRKRIAVIGMACRFPDAGDAAAFWCNLSQGKDSVRRVDAARWALSNDTASNAPEFCAPLNGLDLFDNGFFHLSRREAESMDPQQRLALEEAVHCIEDSGVSLDMLRRRTTAVYAAVTGSDYSLLALTRGEAVDSYAALGNFESITANRISHALDLRGPSLAVDAACASSLVALHEARKSLLCGESDYVLVVASSLSFHPWRYVGFHKAHMMSPTGKCRTFDEKADGFAYGDGVAAVLLQRLDDALADRNQIHGIILGTAVNHCGRTATITSPSVDAQREVVMAAWRAAGVDVSTATYWEAHGTGTPLGDPIEVEAVTQAFGRQTTRRGVCRIGSVKSNIGHLFSAAGLAGVLKVLLMMRHREISPTLNLTAANPVIDFAASPLVPARQAEPWQADDGQPLRAGVTSLGFGGVNAHAVLESHTPPVVEPAPAERLPFVVSAKTEPALRELVARWRAIPLEEAELRNLCLTSVAGRQAHGLRLGGVVGDARDLAALLARAPTAVPLPATDGWELAFAAQTPAQAKVMALAWSHHDLFCRHLAWALAEVGYETDWRGVDDLDAGFALAVAHACARVLIEMGLTPCRLIGDGAGRWAAWTVAGMLSLTEAAEALRHGGTEMRLRRPATIPVWSPPHGRVITPWRLDADYLTQLTEGLSVPAGTARSLLEQGRMVGAAHEGFRRYLAEWAEPLRDAGLLEPDLLSADLSAETGAEVGLFEPDGLRSLAIAVSLGRLGRRWGLAEPAPAGDPRLAELLALLIDQVLPPPALARLDAADTATLAAVADELDSRQGRLDPRRPYPLLRGHSQCGDDLAPLAQWLRQAEDAPPLERGARVRLADHLSVDDERAETLPDALVALWLRGVDICWSNLYPDGSFQKMSLPQYPFQRSRHWVDVSPATVQPTAPRLFHRVWQPIPSPAAPAAIEAIGPVVVFANPDSRPLADALLRTTGWPAAEIIDVGADEPEVWRLFRNGPVSLLLDLADLLPEPRDTGIAMARRYAWLKAMLCQPRGRLDILHLTQGLQDCGGPTRTLAGAEMAGMVRLLGAEYGHVRARTVDMDLGLDRVRDVADLLRTELADEDLCHEVAYRDGQRWRPRLAPTAGKPQTAPLGLSADRVFIVTGGTRGLGAAVARHLVERGARKLLLLGREPVGDGTSEKRRFVDSLAESGAQVETAAVPLTDAANLRRLITDVTGRLGAIGGVVHCAGVVPVEPRPFRDLSPVEMAPVLSPKIEGLLALDQALVGQQLEFMVLFSSVAAVVPALAVGMLPYGVANGFMDWFALQRAASRGSRIISINWPSWKEAGVGEMTSAAYRQSGLLPLSTRQGLDLFDRALASGDTVVLPCLLAEGADPALWSTPRRPPATPAAPPPSPAVAAAPATSVREHLARMLAEELRLPVHDLDPDCPFGEMGVDSILLVGLVKKIEAWLGETLDPTALLEHRSLTRLAAHIAPRLTNGAPAAPEPAFAPAAIARVFERPVSEAVAVVGMACHFPAAPDVDTFWHNLEAGRDCITEVPVSRWDTSRLYSPQHQAGKSISKWGGFIEGIEYFDPEFFGLKPRMVAHLDPLARQFLETAVQAVAHTGMQRTELAGRRVGVFAGSRVSTYQTRIATPLPESILGVGQNFIASHLSHLLDLKGPNLVVDTACSSSLVAIHLARQSLLAGECELALAGGVDILLDEALYLLLSESQALSPDGRCFTFDERANGFVPGEGAGVVVLKPLSAALRDGDCVYAVLDGTAVNNDGRTMGVTTPNPQAQQDVIERALAQSGTDAAGLGYVEAHGTGTMIGDPIELRALTEVFRKVTDESWFCAVGSVKTNIGHLLSAAGVASVIKVALSLHHGIIPATLNCERINPRFSFAESPFYVVRHNTPWRPRHGHCRAGISSFGFSGTNAHAVLSRFEPPSGYRPRRQALPPIRFQRRRFWLDRGGIGAPPQDVGPPVPASFLDLVDETP